MNAQEAIAALEPKELTAVDVAYAASMAENLTNFRTSQWAADPAHTKAYGLFGMVVRIEDALRDFRQTFHKRRRSSKDAIARLEEIRTLATIAILIEQNKWPSNQ